MQGQIGKYKVLGKLGEGAMGEVYRALDPILGREVAIKTLAGHLVGNADLRHRFAREAQSTARLTHNNIVRTYEFGEDGDRVYIAMELLEGSDLRHVLSHQPLLPQQRLDLMEQICAGVAFAHANGVVHRDLKPANIHITPAGTAKIMDFGLARLADSELTKTGMVMGTPNYMAPEQVRGEKCDARADVFALGVLFYELLAGKKPFDADSIHAVLHKVMQQEPRWENIDPTTPVPVIEVMRKALVKDKAARYRNADEMLEALRTARAVAEGRAEPLSEEETPTQSMPAPVFTAGSRPTSGNPRPSTVVARPGSGTVAPRPASATAAPRPASMVGTPPPAASRSPQPLVAGSAALSAAPGSASGVAPTLLGNVRTHVRSNLPPTVMAPPSRSMAPTIPPNVRSMAPTVLETTGGESMPPTVVGPMDDSPSMAPTVLHAPSSAGRAVAIGVAFAAAVVLAGGGAMWLATRPRSAQAERAPDAVAQALAATQMELAQRKLADKDYPGALRQAEHVLTILPGDAAAQKVTEEARSVLARIEASSQGARRAAAEGRIEDAADLLWALVNLDPQHPMADELAAALDRRFRERAEQARSLSTAARAAAESARAGSLDEFRRGADAVTQGDQAFRKGEYVRAGKKMLESRDAFERARRSAQR